MRQVCCHRWLLISAALYAGALGGCARNFGPRACFYSAEEWAQGLFGPTTSYPGSQLQTVYDEAYALEMDANPACVDLYFQTAVLAWPEVERSLATSNVPYGRAADIYRAALAKLVDTGQRFRRFDPSRGLTIRSAGGWLHVPARHRGFVWQPEDIGQLIAVGDYTTKDLASSYCCDGLGVATVAIHRAGPHEKFMHTTQAFPATAVLRPVGPATCASSGFMLELYDPIRVSHARLAGRQVPIVRDLSAPIAFRLAESDQRFVQSFLHPEQSPSQTRLYMVEPYQRGKIPIVFVHGLLSDPFTWASIVNEILARPEFHSRYQLWGFEYATGEPFLRSAAELRAQLRQIRDYTDPYGTDGAQLRMVAVGHSMGGLVAKLLITHSGDTLWRAVSRQPLQQIVTSPATRQRLAQSFFFTPSPSISRVIFIATPHRGSPWASRPIGMLGAALVEETWELETDHRQLVCDNPGVFSEEFLRRVPTSVDLLRADSPLLQAIEHLPVSPRVTMHSVIGTSRPILGGGASDGIVTIDSARHHSVASELVVEAEHRWVHKDPEGLTEIMRILREHLSACCMIQPHVQR